MSDDRGVWQCQRDDCRYKWKARVSEPVKCPKCQSKDMTRIDGGGDVDDGRVGISPQNPDDVAPRIVQTPDGPVQEVSAKVAGDIRTVIDPKEHLINIMSDLGIKNAKSTIANIFFEGDTDDPNWLAHVLKESKVAVPNRKLIVSAYFGINPNEAGVDIIGGGKYKSKNSYGGSGDDEEELTDIDKMETMIKKEEMQNVKKRYIEAKVARMEADAKGGSVNEQSKPILEKKKVKIMCRTPSGVQTLEVNEDEATQTRMWVAEYERKLEQDEKKDKDDKPSMFESLYKDTVKRMEDQQKEFRETMKDFQNNFKERESKLEERIAIEREERQKLHEESLLREIRDTRAAIRGPEQFINEIKKNISLGQSMGLVPANGDDKVSRQIQMTDKVVDQVKGARDDMWKALDRFQSMAKEERMLQQGLTPEQMKQRNSKMTPEEKEKYYAQWSEVNKGVNQQPQQVQQAPSQMSNQEFNQKYQDALKELQSRKDEVEKERASVDSQKKVVELGVQELKKQGEVIERQVKKLESMENNLGKKSGKPEEPSPVPQSEVEPPKTQEEVKE